MSRSNWKIPYSRKSLLKNFFLNKDTKKFTVVYSRNLLILPIFVGKTFFIYDGRKLILLLISEGMIGHKFGEFACTRKKALHKKMK